MPLQRDGLDLLRILKKTAGGAGPQTAIPVGRPASAFLRITATQRERLDRNDVRVLTEWRNRYVNSFLSEFNATEARTADWLVNTVGPANDKLLFMLDDLDNRTFGYMGMAFIDWDRAYGEADAVVRGMDAAPGTMTSALRAMISWSQTKLGLQDIGVRVRSDNAALTFYKKFGFVEEKRIPLRRAENSDTTVWIEHAELATAPIYLVYMRLR